MKPIKDLTERTLKGCVASTRHRFFDCSSKLILVTVIGVFIAFLAIPNSHSKEAIEEVPQAFNPSVGIPRAESSPQDLVEKQDRLAIDLEHGSIDERVERLISVMTLEEKVGQLCQLSIYGDNIPPAIISDLRAGRIGSLFYTGNTEFIAEAQRISLEESRLGLPLLAPRDVIHGFRTVFPIPIGQAASWDADLVERAAKISAIEARAAGVNWTFAPMMDISRDPRWGRIAESLGEDPKLSSDLAAAMIRGFQGDLINESGQEYYDGIAACAKHFAAYGLSEGGRDYNRTQLAVSELHNVHLAPFKASVESNCLTFMTGFNSLNGIPCTGNQELIKGTLKQRWGFKGLVVSDWSGIEELIPHGYARDKKEAAKLAFSAGVDMEMATNTYRDYLKNLVASGDVSTTLLNDAVARILHTKFLVAFPNNRSKPTITAPSEESLSVAKQLAAKSVVLLKNKENSLPLDVKAIKRIAFIGPMVNSERDQLGCWVLDGKSEDSVTLEGGLRDVLPANIALEVVDTGSPTKDISDELLSTALLAAEKADVIVLGLGEGWDLSGEARSRVSLDLLGDQGKLIETLAKTDKPIISIVMSGRPLTIQTICDKSDALLYAWHPGTMGGAAVADILLGKTNPSGKLPVTFPKHVGQIPLYYNHPNTGRPAIEGTTALLGSGRQDFPVEQKFRSHYLDSDPFPLFSFGFGLSYATFEYGPLELTQSRITSEQTLGVRVKITNTGDCFGEEVAQLYLKDQFASLVRPVRELKAFRRVGLDPGESQILEFAICANDLSFYNNQAESVLESGSFQIAVGGNSEVPFLNKFELQVETEVREKAESNSPRQANSIEFDPKAIVAK